jgi:hypothetical protein
MSGCRIIISLLNILEQNNKLVGCAGICNGGGIKFNNFKGEHHQL